jgi:hypothetical protein
MKLPNGDQAVIDPRKIIEYCLSTSHEDGRHKAHLFASILGLTIADADQLLNALRTAAASGEAALGKQDPVRPALLNRFRFHWAIWGGPGSFSMDHWNCGKRASARDVLYTLT